MNRSRLPAVLLGSLLLLGACGGSDEPAASGPTTSPTPEPTTASPGTTAGTPTPTPTPTPTTTPTPGRPTDRLIDYGDDGVVLTTAADVSGLKGAPRDFTTFITRELAAEQASTDEACTEKAQIYVSRIDTGGWASGGHFIPQCGGYASLWARSGDRWKEVWSGQELTDCATLARYDFPADIAGGTCLKGGRQVPYTAGGVDAE